MNFGNFFLVSSLCNVRRDVNRCALLVVRPSWKHFRAVCFPFETQSGSLLSADGMWLGAGLTGLPAAQRARGTVTEIVGRARRGRTRGPSRACGCGRTSLAASSASFAELRAPWFRRRHAGSTACRPCVVSAALSGPSSGARSTSRSADHAVCAGAAAPPGRVLRWLRGAARGVVRRQHAAGLAGFPAVPRAHCPEYRDAIL